jgi:hypothetical protein
MKYPIATTADTRAASCGANRLASSIAATAIPAYAPAASAAAPAVAAGSPLTHDVSELLTEASSSSGDGTCPDPVAEAQIIIVARRASGSLQRCGGIAWRTPPRRRTAVRSGG